VTGTIRNQRHPCEFGRLCLRIQKWIDKAIERLGPNSRLTYLPADISLRPSPGADPHRHQRARHPSQPICTRGAYIPRYPTVSGTAHIPACNTEVLDERGMSATYSGAKTSTLVAGREWSLSRDSNYDQIRWGFPCPSSNQTHHTLKLKPDGLCNKHANPTRIAVPEDPSAGIRARRSPTLRNRPSSLLRYNRNGEHPDSIALSSRGDAL
jgi:hypothetical protein